MSTKTGDSRAIFLQPVVLIGSDINGYFNCTFQFWINLLTHLSFSPAFCVGAELLHRHTHTTTTQVDNNYARYVSAVKPSE